MAGAEEKLRLLGVFPGSVAENVEIFRKGLSIDEIAQGLHGLAAKGKKQAIGPEQFVYFHLGALLNDDGYRAEFLQRANQELGGLGISVEHIAEYFAPGSWEPQLIFLLSHGKDYGLDIQDAFYRRADQFAIDEFRKWLGFK